MPVSIVILTKNSERTIKKCLEAVKGLSDDVIVWDSQSKDGTVKIAKKYTKKVFIFDDKNRTVTGAKLKNLAVAKAKHDWVFSLDSDEYVDKTLYDAIGKAIEQEQFVGFNVRRKDYTFLKTYVHTIPILRLYRKSKGEFRHSVHEKVYADGPVGTLAGTLYHDSIADAEDYINRFNHHTNIEGRRMADSVPLNMPRLIGQVAVRPWIEFGYWYVFRGLWRRGFGGLFYSLCSGFYQVVKYLKYYERKQGLKKD
ncbi:hypothetical protein CMO91_04475 [Candidatus Woesearchaeota archaeon]|nr:hypothetical protein [Candidatus Woesearchaeota archaeon]|tara:strand:+ start:699 stop:1460 length:762 start_codon:yes stop_codon:yes gene_type:complete